MFGDAPPEADIPPRISRRSRHHAFAVLVLAGYTYDTACQQLAINPRTAERWRTDLRKRARHYFRRPVTYEYAARVAIDPDLRRLCETLRGSPQ